MALSDYKISGSEINTNGVVSAPDILTGTTQENKAIFDKLPTLITNKFNALIDSLSASGAAEIGSQPFDEITAKNIQDALKQIRDLIGSYYIGADGAGKVGYTPSEGVDEDTVQAAIEAVQANLAAYIAKIKAATGAAEVGNAPIVGMTATNVQHALEELRKNIDNIVSGIIPGGSITSDMIQDGAVTADKLGSDVTGEEIPTSASDPTSISSQLSNTIRKYVEIQSGTDLNAVVESGIYRLNGNSSGFTNGPPSNNHGWGIMFVGGYLDDTVFQMLHILGGDIWKRMLQGGVLWSEWIKLSDATPPQKRSLPLEDGWVRVNAAEYWIMQECIVIVTFRVARENGGAISAGIHKVATLPDGFRPAGYLSRAVISKMDGDNMGSAWVDTNGGVYCNTGAEIPQSSGSTPDLWHGFAGTFVFVAE